MRILLDIKLSKERAQCLLCGLDLWGRREAATEREAIFEAIAGENTDDAPRLRLVGGEQPVCYSLADSCEGGGAGHLAIDSLVGRQIVERLEHLCVRDCDGPAT